MSKKKEWNDKALPVAMAFTLVEGLSGMVCCVVYLLFNQCVFRVPSLDSNSSNSAVDIIAYIFYSSYVTTGECNWSNSDEHAQVLNPNTLTKPNVVFIWQTVYLVLYIAWLMTSSLLIVSNRLSSLYPWFIMTSIIIITDLVNTSILLTDVFVDISGVQDSFFKLDEYRDWSISLMMMWSSRAGILWFLNIFLLFAVFSKVKGSKAAKPSEKYWTSKKFEDIRKELSNAPSQNQIQGQQPRQFNPHQQTQFQTPQQQHQQFQTPPQQHQNFQTPSQQHLHFQTPQQQHQQHFQTSPQQHSLPEGQSYSPDHQFRPQSQYQRQISHQIPEDTDDQYEPEPNHLYQSLYKHEQQPRHYAEPASQHRRDPEVRGEMEPPGEAIYQRPMSFKDKVRQASFNNQRSVGGMFSYAGNIKRDNVLPDQDVETAFNFLSKYEDTSSKRSSSVFPLDEPSPARRDHTRDMRRTSGLDDRPNTEPKQPDGHFQIPRAKVATNLSRSSSMLRRQEDSKLKDYETRYFVPLKH